jgi:hypothetical protein
MKKKREEIEETTIEMLERRSYQRILPVSFSVTDSSLLRREQHSFLNRRMCSTLAQTPIKTRSIPLISLLLSYITEYLPPPPPPPEAFAAPNFKVSSSSCRVISILAWRTAISELP